MIKRDDTRISDELAIKSIHIKKYTFTSQTHINIWSALDALEYAIYSTSNEDAYHVVNASTSSILLYH